MAHFENLTAAIGRSGPRKQWEHRDSRLFNWQRGLNFVGLAGTPEADNASDRYGALLPFPWSPLTRKSLNGVKDRDSTYNGDESPFVFSRCEILRNLFTKISFRLYTRSYIECFLYLGFLSWLNTFIDTENGAKTKIVGSETGIS